MTTKPERNSKPPFSGVWSNICAPARDVQNIDLMNLAGFCRNCLSNWMKEEADAKGVGISKDESREAVYGMPYETWKSKFQGTASPEQLEAMKKAQAGTEPSSIRSARVSTCIRFHALRPPTPVTFLLWARCG